MHSKATIAALVGTGAVMCYGLYCYRRTHRSPPLVQLIHFNHMAAEYNPEVVAIASRAVPFAIAAPAACAAPSLPTLCVTIRAGPRDGAHDNLDLTTLRQTLGHDNLMVLGIRLGSVPGAFKDEFGYPGEGRIGTQAQYCELVVDDTKRVILDCPITARGLVKLRKWLHLSA